MPLTKLRLLIIVLTKLGVTELLCSFRLVLERKTGKELAKWSRLEFLEKFSVNNFALLDSEDYNYEPLNRGYLADLPLLRTLLAICKKSWDPSIWEMMDYFVLLTYASLVTPRNLHELSLRFRRFILFIQRKKVISNMVPATTAENHRDEWDFNCYLRLGT